MEIETREAIRRLASGESLPVTDSLLDTLKSLVLGYIEDGSEVRLAEPLELLDPAKIAAGIPEAAKLSLSKLDIFWDIDSTNTWLLARSDETDFHGHVCLAEQQLAGRGRRGRHWVSPFGKNIYLSIGCRMATGNVSIGGLSLVIGMQVVSVLRDIGIRDVGLKWPNDVLARGGKLAGILIEMAPSRRGEARLVIGVGVNLRLDEQDAQQIDQQFSTIKEQMQISRNQLVAELIGRITAVFADFEKTGFSAWAKSWHDFNLYEGQPVLVKSANSEVQGIDRGVDTTGNLLLETADGLRTFNAGEVSLRSID